MPNDYLTAIDAQRWPGIASVPSGRILAVRARRAEAEFARACQRAGVELDPDAPGGPDLLVHETALFSRIARSGWLGVAESYMAGEWTTPDSDALVNVLTRLLTSSYAPRAKQLAVGESTPGELPAGLISLYCGDGLSHHGGIFSTGVPTTVRESFESFVPRAGRGGEPREHFVDVTRLSPPSAVDRQDLGDAQRNAADWLLDATRTGAGSHLLVYPASGAQAAVRATERRATVDLLSSDADRLALLDEQLVLEGAIDSVHCQLIDAPVPGPDQWRGRYDGIVSVEKLETLAPRERLAYVAALDRLLASGGRVVVQSLVATESMTPAGRAACQVMRAYIWPGLDFPTAVDVHRLCDRHSNLRVVAQTHFGAHYRTSLAQQRSYFAGRLREAAAAGFDPVFRRMWMYQFALREALLQLEMLDSVQFTATHRNRGGRR